MRSFTIKPRECDSEDLEKFMELFKPNYFCESTIVDVSCVEKINGKKFENNQKLYWYDVPKLWDNEFNNTIYVDFALTDSFGNMIEESIDDDCDKDKDNEFIQITVITNDDYRNLRKPTYDCRCKFTLSGDYSSFVEDILDIENESKVNWFIDWQN